MVYARPQGSVVVLGPEPSLLNIQVVEALPECGVLVTASDAGVVLWRLPSEAAAAASGGEAPAASCAGDSAGGLALQLRPYALLLPPSMGRVGGASVVTALVGCVSAGVDDRACVATAAACGDVCVWHIPTGRCLRAGAGVISFVASRMRALPDRQYVVCAGQACELEVVNLQQMAVVHRLSGHHNWIQDVAVQRLGVSLSALVVSACRDGALRFWDMLHEPMREPVADEAGRSGVYAVVRNASKHDHVLLPPAQFGCGGTSQVVSLHMVSDGGVLLVVTPECARLFRCDSQDPGAMSCVGSFALPDPEMHRLAGGAVCSGCQQPAWRLALWTVEGSAALVEVSESGVVEDAVELPTETSCGLPITEVEPQAWCRHNMPGKDIQTAASGGRFLASAGATGHVVMWAIAEFASGSDSKASPGVCEPWAVGTVEDGWNLVKAETEPSSQMSTERRKVSATALAAEENWPLILARGYTDGSVSVCTLPSDPNPVKLLLHSALVTEVKLVAQDDPFRLLLLSCSRDGTVCVFDVAQRKLLSTSRHHRGAVTSLHLPPRTAHGGEILPATRMLGPHVCSVGEDRCVCVHTLASDEDGGIGCCRVFGGLASPVTDVHWSSDDDSLFVRSRDGALSIWLLDSGVFERRISSADADSVLAQATQNQSHEPSNSALQQHVNGPYSTSPGGVPKVPAAESHRAVVQSAQGCCRHDDRTAASYAPPLYVLTFDLIVILEDLQACHVGNTGQWWQSLPQHFAAALAFLFPWGIDTALDEHVQNMFNLQRPSLSVGLAVPGAAAAFTAVYPSACTLSSPMRQGCHLASAPALSLIILSTALLAVPGHRDFHSSLVSQYVEKLLAQGDGAVAATEQLLVYFVRHWVHPSVETRRAASCLFVEVVFCLQPQQRKQLARFLSASLQQTCVRFQRMMAGEVSYEAQSESASRCFSIFCLSRLAIVDASCIELDDCRTIARTIATLVLWHSDSTGDPLWLWRNLAAGVLGDGFAMWRPYIADPGWLMNKLLKCCSPLQPSKDNAMDLHNQRCVLDSLISVGKLETKLFLQLLRQEVLTPKETARGATYRSNVAAIEMLTKMVRCHPAALLDALDDLASIVVSAMTPAVPELRRSCFQACKLAIMAIVETYPMASFHKETQRLAVGLANTCVAIFDLNSAKKLLTLRGHTASVTAVCFGLDEKGLHVASYSAIEKSARCWHPSAGNGHCKCTAAVAFDARQWDKVRMRWATPSRFELIEGNMVLQAFQLP